MASVQIFLILSRSIISFLLLGSLEEHSLNEMIPCILIIFLTKPYDDDDDDGQLAVLRLKAISKVRIG